MLQDILDQYSLKGFEDKEKTEEELKSYIQAGSLISTNAAFVEVLDKRLKAIVHAIFESLKARQFDHAYALLLIKEEIEGLYQGFEDMRLQAQNVKHLSNSPRPIQGEDPWQVR